MDGWMDGGMGDGWMDGLIDAFVCKTPIELRLRSLFVKTDWVCHVWCNF